MPLPRTCLFLPKGQKAAATSSPEGHPANSSFWSSECPSVPALWLSKAFLMCWSENDGELLDFGAPG